MPKFLADLSRNPISLIGTAVTTASALLFLSLFGMELVGLHGNPYIGILAYLILPGVFLAGLILIPIGVWRERRRLARGEGKSLFPVIDLNRSPIRRRVLVVLLLTMANVVILATATYKGVETMDTAEFCGATCHTVMQPEYTAFQRSPHAGTSCVDCHIGPGAGWFVKSKLSGAWQVVAVAFDLYPRPIPTPVENLRPARETCEQCHWPNKFVGDRLDVRTHYLNDEQNTEVKTVLLMRVGGVQGRQSHGIHWHVDPGVEIRYAGDPTRETIYEVEMRTADGSKHFVGDEKPEEGEPLEWRTMDCIDCHNRPTHVYRTAEEAIDEALVEQHMPRDLPFVRREALAAIRQEYPDHEAARAGIADALRAFYRDTYPEIAATREADIERAVQAAGDAYSWNVFPAMNVGWGTYPDHIGHTNFTGCFRCHDDLHATADGETISQDCDTCHTLLALEEEDPEILEQLRP